MEGRASIAAANGNGAAWLVVFKLDDLRYALRLSVVEQVFRAVEITALPKAPEMIEGVINVRGNIVPVYRIRTRFRLPPREQALNDQLLVARTARRTVALMVDQVCDVIEREDGRIIAAQEISPGLDYVEGVVKLEGGLVFIHDLDTFLSLDEERKLERALKATNGETS
jgi:purine-binding chemotaxis protein CheW